MPLDTKSVHAHDACPGGYIELNVYRIERMNKKAIEDRMHYDADKPLGKMMDEHPNVKIAVDIGSGLGWSSKVMSDRMDVVYAIEPSQQAHDKVSKLYEDTKNIIFINGFAEDALKEIAFKEDEPVLFNSLVVLSHLEDNAVIAICEQINRLAPKGSVLSFSELWGNESHAEKWHTRTQRWWKKNLSSFDINFIEHRCQIDGRYKSFTGVKTL